MKAYRVSVDGQPDMVRYEGNVRAAHRFAKNQWRAFINEAFIDLVEVSSDKDTMLKLLNNAPLPELHVLGSWNFTKRGGLHKIEGL